MDPGDIELQQRDPSGFGLNANHRQRLSYSERLSTDTAVQSELPDTLRAPSLRSTATSRYSTQFQGHGWKQKRRSAEGYGAKLSSSTQRATKGFARKTKSIVSWGLRPVKFLKRPFVSLKAMWRRRKILPPTKDGRRIPVGLSTVVPAALIDERNGKRYCSNIVSSGIYSVWDFVPRQLVYQFSKLANVYFLFVSILQMIPSWSTTGSYTTIIPLMIFVGVAMAREGYDDWCRHQNDREENNRTVMVAYSQDGKVEYKTVAWKDIKVGEIIRVLQNEWVPADIALLHSSGPKGTASVETLALDGETTLKSKEAPSALQEAYGVDGLLTTNGLCISEDPNLDLYNFEGSFELTDGKICPLSSSNVILRGCMLRNTASVTGLVVFTGKESKIQMNANRDARAKSPKLQTKVNHIVMLMACYVLLLSGFSTLASGRIQAARGDHYWYLKDLHVGTTQNVMGFIIMFNTLIPLSLYVSMEICKLFQMFLMENDVDMYDATNDVRMSVQTASLNEELGQVSYIFSDKTGTLTDNIMLFRKLSIAGYPWLHDLDLYFQDDNDDEDSDFVDCPIEEDGDTELALQFTNRTRSIPQTTNADADEMSSGDASSNTTVNSDEGNNINSKKTKNKGYLFHKAKPRPGQLLDLAETLGSLPRKSFGGRVSNANRIGISRPSISRPSMGRVSLGTPGRMSTSRPSMGRTSRVGRPSRQSRPSRLSGPSRPSHLTTGRPSAVGTEDEEPAWHSTANPNKPQVTPSTLLLLEYVMTHPNTSFSKRARFFLLALALCHSATPEIDLAQEADGTREIEALDYQASSPDELALVSAARDLGYLVIDRQQDSITIRTYPHGFDNPPKDESYEILASLEFTSARKRMSNIVKFPDGRICLFCKGADNVMIERLKKQLLTVAQTKQGQINHEGVMRRSIEADLANSTGFGPVMSRNSVNIPGGGGISSLDEILRRSDAEAAIQESGRRSMQLRKRSMEVRKSVELNVALAQRRSIERQEGFTSPPPPAHMMDPISHSDTREDSRDDTGVKFAGNSDDGDDESRDDDMGFDFGVLEQSDNLDDRAILERTLEQIDEFSTEGLRTLLYGHRFIPRGEFKRWKMEYEAARSALTDRQKKLEDVGEKMEVDLEVTGATAIEDKLQKGVPETIDKLRRANIRMWMLTGDKRETAINIGYSCRLIKDYSTVIILRKEEDLNAKIMAAMEELEQEEIAHCVVVVDGGTLARIETDAILLSMFIDLGLKADSVIVCRASPAQKATMVKSVRKREPSKVMLAIGDGANDIAMIQSADLGIGIAGREGLQAARSSDYAIGQFRFLLKLLLVHGRWNYVRTCKYILSTFYKEFVFYMGQVIYQRNTMFTGTSLYESWSISMFNTLFTSLPVICLGVMDQDLSPTTLIAIPELYSVGQQNKSFGFRLFFGWLVMGMLQSLMINFCSYMFYGENYGVNDPSLFPLGVVVYTSVVYLICIKIQFITMMHYITAMSVLAALISMVGWLFWNLLIGGVYHLQPSKTYFAEYEFQKLLGRDLVFWASIFVITVIGCTWELLVYLVRTMIRPSETDDFQILEMEPSVMARLEQEAHLELHQGWAFQEQMDTKWTAFFRGKWPGQPRFRAKEASEKVLRTNRRRKRDIIAEKLHIKSHQDYDREIEEILARRARETAPSTEV